MPRSQLVRTSSLLFGEPGCLLKFVITELARSVMDKPPTSCVVSRHGRPAAVERRDDLTPYGLLVLTFDGEHHPHEQLIPVAAGGGVMRRQGARAGVVPRPAQRSGDGRSWLPVIGATLEQEHSLMDISSPHHLSIDAPSPPIQ